MKLVGPISTRSGCGYIDSEGQVRIPFVYQELGAFCEGLAWFEFNNKIGFIDESNAVVIPPRFERGGRMAIVSHFSCGLASVCQGGKEGYIDRSGEFKIPCKFQVCSPFVEGCALVSEGDGFSVIDVKGNVLSRLDCASVAEMPYGKDCIKIYKLEGEEHFPAFVDRFGNVRLGPFRGLEDIGRFSTDRPWLAYARQRVPQLIGFINSKGETVLPFSFLNTTGFSEGLAAVSNAEYCWGYADADGTWVIPPHYTWAMPFRNGTAAVQTGRRKAARWHIIDREGCLGFSQSFDRLLLETENSFRIFLQGQTIVVLNTECDIIWRDEI